MREALPLLRASDDVYRSLGDQLERLLAARGASTATNLRDRFERLPKADVSARSALLWSELAAPKRSAATSVLTKLAEEIVHDTRSAECGPLQLFAEALFANGSPDEAAAKMQRAMRVWRSARPAQQKALGERNLEWMQQRVKQYRKQR